MASITIRFLDGSETIFAHEGRAGYEKKVHYEGGFVIVEDEQGKKIAFPASRIREVVEMPDRPF